MFVRKAAPDLLSPACPKLPGAPSLSCPPSTPASIQEEMRFSYPLDSSSPAGELSPQGADGEHLPWVVTLISAHLPQCYLRFRSYGNYPESPSKQNGTLAKGQQMWQLVNGGAMEINSQSLRA